MMFTQRTSVKQGKVNMEEIGELDGLERMLRGNNYHCAVAEEYAIEKEAAAFEAVITQMERDRATALQYSRRFDTVR